MMKNIMLFLAIGLMTSTAYAGDCAYSENVERNIDLSGVSELFVEAGAGTLEIVGEDNRDDVLVTAKLCSSDDDLLSEMSVKVVIESGSAHFETVFPDRSFWNNSTESMKIDLVLTVPSSASLIVKDSSGEASVDNVAELDMKDSSGRLTIENIAGDMVVVDSSGELRIRNIGGDVEVTDSSGAIDVVDVSGSLLVVADSSGAIEAKRIAKNVTIERDSSGAIEVKDVGGDFIVLRDSSGGIRYKNVDGQVELPN